MIKELVILEHPVYLGYGADEDGNVYSFNYGKIKSILHHSGYNVINVRLNKKQKNYSVHKFVYECFNGVVILSVSSGEGSTIDHIDGNRLNNNIKNLQILSHRENTQKKYKNKFSLYTGVVIDKRHGYIYSQITTSKKVSHLGMFKTELDAATAYDDRYETIHGLRPNKTKNNNTK